jgi:hypothetical protein
MNDLTMNNSGKDEELLAGGALGCISHFEPTSVVTSTMFSTSDDGWEDA